MTRPTKRGATARLDQALLARGLAPDLKEARALIMAGEVRVNGQKADRPDRPVRDAEEVGIARNRPYASRGALKIEAAARGFALARPGLKVLDIGISNGGFSDYFLRHGAGEVLGVDVTISQVDSRLRQDPRLRLLQKNARFLVKGDVPFEPDLVVIDLSFISITAVLPVLRDFPGAKILALVKPQFEAARGGVGRGGVVRERERRLEILRRIKHRVEEQDFAVLGCCPSGLRGRRGNQEYFFLLEQGKKKSLDDTMLADAVDI